MMTEMIQDVTDLGRTIDKTLSKPGEAERAAIREMVKSATDRGLALTGPDGLLKIMTKTVLETALDEEMTAHLGYEKHAAEGRDGGNSATVGGSRRCSPTMSVRSRSRSRGTGRAVSNR